MFSDYFSDVPMHATCLSKIILLDLVTRMLFGEGYRLLVTVSGWYRIKRPMHCGHFWSIVHRPTNLTDFSRFVHQRCLTNISRHTKKRSREKFDEKCPLILDAKCLSYSAGIFNIPYNITTWDDSFTSPPKEVVQRIFIAIKYVSSSAGFEPANLGSNRKHDNY
jgi:hypothetical protein